MDITRGANAEVGSFGAGPPLTDGAMLSAYSSDISLARYRTEDRSTVDTYSNTVPVACHAVVNSGRPL